MNSLMKVETGVIEIDGQLRGNNLAFRFLVCLETSGLS